MEKIQVNKIKSWFQTTHNKDIYQWRTHKHKSISSLKQETYKTNILPLSWISQQSKTNVTRAKKVKVQSESLRYNLSNSTSSNQQKTTLPLKTKTKCKVLSICTPPFCDGMPKGNQNPSSKGGGSEERRNCAKSACKPRISSRTSTKICPWAA